MDVSDKWGEKMRDLIKREDVLKQIWEWVTNREFNYTNATHWLQKRIEAIPTIDAVSVVRGAWKAKSFHEVYCDNCGFTFDIMKCDFLENMKFCPNCGARMKGADDE